MEKSYLKIKTNNKCGVKLLFWLFLLRSSSDHELKAFARNASEMLKCGHVGKHQEIGLHPQCILLVLKAPCAFVISQRLLLSQHSSQKILRKCTNSLTLLLVLLNIV